MQSMDSFRDYYKKLLWNDFITEWNEPYELAKNAIKLINLYPERLKLVGLGNLLEYHEIDESQKEWVWLNSQLDNQIDRDYLKPYLVPINSDDFKVFIDISKNEMPLIEPGYDFVSKDRWMHLTRFESALELIQFLDSEITEPPPIDKEFSKSLTDLLNKHLGII
jgi:hypothetical protein